MLPRANRRAALADFVERLRGAFGSHLVDVRLFGSEARGDATAESDIDVLIVVTPDDARVALEDRAGATPFLKAVQRESLPL